MPVFLLLVFWLGRASVREACASLTLVIVLLRLGCFGKAASSHRRELSIFCHATLTQLKQVADLFLNSTE